MRLTEQQLNEGREFLKSKDLDGFITWYKAHFPLRNPDAAKKLFDLHLNFTNDIPRALEHFDQLIATNCDPAADVREALFKIGALIAFIILGVLTLIGAAGGLMHLLAP